MYYVWLKPCSTSKNNLKWWALSSLIHIFINIYVLKGCRGQKVTPKGEKMSQKLYFLRFLCIMCDWKQVGGLSPLHIVENDEPYQVYYTYFSIYIYI